MRIRICTACGRHYESRSRTPRKLLHMLRECGKRARSVVERLQEVAPLGEERTHEYLIEQLQHQAHDLHQQFADRLFSICAGCANAGCYLPSPVEESSTRAREALGAVQAIKPSLGKLVHLASESEHRGQLSLAHVGGSECLHQKVQSVGPQRSEPARCEEESSPRSKREPRRRKPLPRSSPPKGRKSGSSSRTGRVVGTAT